MHATRYHVHAQLQVAPRRGPLTALRDEALNEGEDALFVTTRCIGVADGVGSWAHEKGIDAGEFSRGARLARFSRVARHQRTFAATTKVLQAL